MDKKKILIWGWFGHTNVGDDLLLNAIITQICKSTDCKLTIPMYEKYDYLDTSILQIDYDIHMLLKPSVIDCHDVLIIGPGGLFPIDDTRYLLYIYRIVKVWKKKSRKVIFWGIGISEAIGIPSIILWNRIVSKTNLFLTRNQKFFPKIHFRENEDKHSIPDVVFGSMIFKKNVICNRRVIVSVANLDNNNKESKAYLDSIEIWKTVVSYILSLGYGVDLIAFTKGSDDILIEDIANFFNDQNIRLIKYKDAKGTIYSWNEYSFAICMRFHAFVLSILAHVPSLAIAYGQKTVNLAEKCNLNDYLIKWNPYKKEYFGNEEDVESDDIISKIELLLANIQQVRDKMIRASEKEISEAKQAYLKLEKILDENNEIM